MVYKPHLTGESSMGFALSGVGMSQNKKEQGIMKNTLKELKPFIILWLTQSLSALGSAMTGFALVIWERFGVYNVIIDYLLVCAIYFIKHFCRCGQRPLE